MADEAKRKFLLDAAKLSLLKGDERWVFLLKLIHEIKDKSRGEKGDTGDLPPVKELKILVEGFLAKWPRPKDGKPGSKGDRGERGRDGQTPSEEYLREIIEELLPEPINILPDDPQEIRNKLESLKGNERLSISAINNLREELDELKKKTRGSTVVVSSGGTGGGRIIKEHDLSASLDGVTKTFSLPAFYAIRLVVLSSFPNILRPTTDFTVDASAMTITFTSEINAATSLASGQTLVILYAEI